MARRRKTKSTHRPLTLLTVHPYAAGIDIGSRFHVVAVSPELTTEPVRTSQSFTNDLHRMADWLVDLGITTVAMESTGIYWIPAFEILEARGVEVLLVNARHVKNPVVIETVRQRFAQLLTTFATQLATVEAEITEAWQHGAAWATAAQGAYDTVTAVHIFIYRRVHSPQRRGDVWWTKRNGGTVCG